MKLKQRWRKTKKHTLWNWECADCGKKEVTNTLRIPKGWDFDGYGFIVVLCKTCKENEF